MTEETKGEIIVLEQGNSPTLPSIPPLCTSRDADSVVVRTARRAEDEIHRAHDAVAVES